MQGIIDKFSISRAKTDVPEIKTGQTVKVYQKIKEGEKERVQIFQGLVIAMHRKQGTSATITVRKDSFGVGVERIFPLSAPFIEKIEVIKQAKIRRSKLFYMRELKGKKARLKNMSIDTKSSNVVVPEVVAKTEVGQEISIPEITKSENIKTEEKSVKDEVKQEKDQKEV
ncbi:50S ribosomal protein L19 [bacterium]|nr:MAG: 50S ribosomal protein L19 [bacterium]